MRRFIRWLAIPALATVARGANPPPAFADDPLNGEERWFTFWSIQWRADHGPASCDGVLAVGAVDSDNEPWERSERPDYAAVAAPGVRVAQMRLGQVTRVSGTGTASGLAAGAVALVRSAFPDEDARAIVDRILTASTPAPDDGDNPAIGNGTINITEALASTDTGDTSTGTGGGSDQDAAGTGADGVSVGMIADNAGAGVAVILVLVVVLMTARRRSRVSTAVPGWPAPNGNPPST